MSIENALRGFVSSKEAGALVLQGKWGLGKTYFWRQRIIEPFLADERVPKRQKHYSYVSMFGVESLGDLKAAIFQSANEFDSEFLASNWRFINIWWLWWKLKRILPHALESAAIPYLGEGLARSYNALTFFSIRNRLICIDDLERRGSGLALRDVLGLISQLAEQRACRVVVILNTGALEGDDQRTWNENKEKVFIGEMTFSPTVAECIDLGLADAKNEIWCDLARDCLLRLGVSNIRITHRAKRSIRKAIASVGGRQLRDETIDRLVRVIVMLEYAHSGKSEGAPSMDLVLGTGPFDYALDNMMKKEMTPEEKKWQEVISAYDVYFGDDLDAALASMIRVGFPDQAELATAIDQFEDRAQASAYKEAWHGAWRLYHDTFAENREEIVTAMEQAWPPVSNVENVGNLQSLSRLLRSLGHPEVASGFIRDWVDQRRGPRIAELSHDYFHMFGPINDPEIVAAMAAAYAVERPLPPLSEAIKKMASSDGIHRDCIEAIAKATPETIIEVLDANEGAYLTGAVSNLLSLGNHPEDANWAISRENVVQALTRMAGRSVLSADRMRNKFKIQVEPEPARRADEGE